MKKTLLFVAVALMFCELNAQVVTTPVITPYKRPAVIMDVYGGYSLPMMDLKGANVGEVLNFKSYGMSGGFCVGFNTKAVVAKLDKSEFRVYLDLSYTQYAETENNAYGIYVWKLGWPYQYGTNIPGGYGGYNPANFTPKAGTSYSRMNIPQLEVGGEFAVYTDAAYKSSFSFGAGMLLSDISGRIYDQLEGQPEIFVTYHRNLRMGFGLKAQYNYRVSEAFGFNIGSKFQWQNAYGKSSELTDSDGYMFLNDNDNLGINSALSSPRNIANLNFYGGVSFYIGTRK